MKSVIKQKTKECRELWINNMPSSFKMSELDKGPFLPELLL